MGSRDVFLNLFSLTADKTALLEDYLNNTGWNLPTFFSRESHESILTNSTDASTLATGTHVFLSAKARTDRKNSPSVSSLGIKPEIS